MLTTKAMFSPANAYKQVVNSNSSGVYAISLFLCFRFLDRIFIFDCHKPYFHSHLIHTRNCYIDQSPIFQRIILLIYFFPAPFHALFVDIVRMCCHIYQTTISPIESALNSTRFDLYL